MVAFQNEKTLVRTAFGLWCSDRPDAGIVVASVRNDEATCSASVLLGHAGCAPVALIAAAVELLKTADEMMSDAQAADPANVDFTSARTSVASAQAALGFSDAPHRFEVTP